MSAVAVVHIGANLGHYFTYGSSPIVDVHIFLLSILPDLELYSSFYSDAESKANNDRHVRESCHRISTSSTAWRGCYAERTENKRLGVTSRRGTQSPLNCATRLNLHYPIVGTALPFSARPSFADRCTWLR